MENSNPTTIAGRAWACAIRFNAVVSQASQAVPAFEDQLARFNIWAANLGVFAGAHASLDYRIRNSQKVKAVMMQLLQSLQRKLQFALETMQSEERQHEDNDTSVASTKSDDNDSDSSLTEASISSTSSSNSSPTSEPKSRLDRLTQIMRAVEAAINRLHRLAMFIRSSSTRRHDLTSSKFSILDDHGDDISMHFEGFARRIVQARFPSANPILHKRIANLILQRRKIFVYQQRHQQKLAKVVNPVSQFPKTYQPTGNHPEVEHTWSPQPSERSVISKPQTLLQGLAIKTALSSTTATALTATSILSQPAPSVVSSSAASSSPGKTALSFPRAPNVRPIAKEFQCPYCGLLLPVRERKPRRWRKHVIKDLEPYVCLFEYCNTASQTYCSVDAWIKHMKSAHALKWYCGVPNCRNQSFDDQATFESHMELLHAGTYSSSQLPLLMESMMRPAAQIFECCPLCNYIPEIQQPTARERRAPLHVDSTEKMHKHIAAHLESLALISLPWQDEVDEASSNRSSPTGENRSTFRNTGATGLEEVSLCFEDPPQLEPLNVEIQEPDNFPWYEENMIASNEAEWGFVRSLPYYGHSQDKILQSMIRKYLSTHVEELDTKQATEDETAVNSMPVELRTMCDWVSPMDFAAEHERLLTLRQENTCEWFVESPAVASFMANPGTVLWAKGIPGSGKTFLSSAMVDYLTHFTPSSAHRPAVAYAYCNHRMHESQTALGIVAGFLRQLLEIFWETHKTIPNDVQATYALCQEAQMGPSMIDCLKMLTTVIVGSANVFVVIDGFDECSTATRHELIDAVRSLKPSIHLLITSRHLGEIEKILGDVPIVEICAPESDLKCYAQGCIRKYPELQAHLGSLSDEVREGYLGEIARSAAGIFPVVRALVEQWAGDFHLHASRPPSLSLVSHELDTFYGENMTRILHQQSLDSTFARHVLIWVAFTRRPVTVSEVSDVVGAEAILGASASRGGLLVDSELFSTVCAGIITVDPKTGILRPVHVTLKGYLQRNRVDLSAHSQEYITTCCLDYLLLEEFKEGPCTNDRAMLDRLQKRPFFHYAATNWGYHALAAGEASCKNALITFLDNRTAVASAVQAKSMPYNWRLYPQSIDSESYPHEMAGIALAASFGLASTVESMLDRTGIETGQSDNNEALFWAAKEGTIDVLDLLLARGISPNVRGAMRAAAEGGYENVIRLLAANGGDVNAESDENEGNALQIAAIKGNESLIRCLLELGADPNIGGGEFGGVLHIASVNGDESITQLLLENGADPNTKGGMYGSPLQAAVEEGHKNIIQMLLASGADVNLEGGPYGNALQAAVENGDRDIVELLLAYGANVNTTVGGEKYTALQEVARRGLVAMVELLIDQGANIDSRQRNGQTALHQAAKEGQAEVVTLLLRKGANHSIRDQRGFKAIDWAIKKGFSEVVTALEAAQQLQT